MSPPVLLDALLRHRGLSPSSAADGLRALAPVLGWHAVDLFILAGADVPEDLAPLDAAASEPAHRFLQDASQLPAAEQQHLLRLAGSLPQERRQAPFTLRPAFPNTRAGAAVVRMLQYRNLGLAPMARLLARTTPSYLAASTYFSVARGRAPLTPRLVADSATLLGIDPTDLAAATGIPIATAPDLAAEIPKLLWETRRLSATQTHHLAETARSMRPRP